MIICIGPFCIPLYGLLPLLTGILFQFRAWLFRVMGWGAEKKRDDDSHGSSKETASTTTSTRRVEPNSTPGVIVIPHAEDELEALVARREAILLYGTAKWCGPCKKMSPVVEELAQTYPHVTVLKVDVDELPEAASRYGMNALPTFVARDANGEETARIYGSHEQELRKAMERCFGGSSTSLSTTQ